MPTPLFQKIIRELVVYKVRVTVDRRLAGAALQRAREVRIKLAVTISL